MDQHPNQKKKNGGGTFRGLLSKTTRKRSWPMFICQAESCTFGVVFLNFKKRKVLKQTTWRRCDNSLVTSPRHSPFHYLILFFQHANGLETVGVPSAPHFTGRPAGTHFWPRIQREPFCCQFSFGGGIWRKVRRGNNAGGGQIITVQI